MKVFWVDQNDNYIAAKGVTDFTDGLGQIVAVLASPSGDIYYCDMDGAVYKYVVSSLLFSSLLFSSLLFSSLLFSSLLFSSLPLSFADIYLLLSLISINFH